MYICISICMHSYACPFGGCQERTPWRISHVHVGKHSTVSALDYPRSKLSLNIQKLWDCPRTAPVSRYLGVSKNLGAVIYVDPKINSRALIMTPTRTPIFGNSHTVPMIRSTLNLPYINPKSQERSPKPLLKDCWKQPFACARLCCIPPQSSTAREHGEQWSRESYQGP